MTDNSVIVAGGGIAGVATALAFGVLGKPVRLLEQADQIGAIGYGVQLGPNVLPALTHLGISDAVQAAAYFPTSLQLYELTSGLDLGHIPLQSSDFKHRYGGAKYMAIHRVDLHEILLAACKKLPNIDLNQSTTVTGYKNFEGGVHISTVDGQTITGAALVAADGLRSRLRAQMHPQDTPRDTGYVAHRTLVPMSQAPKSIQHRECVTMWTGDGFHVIYYPLRNRKEMNVVVVVRLPVTVDPTDTHAYHTHVAAIIASAKPEAQDVIAMVNFERRWNIADRNPIRQWSDGNVTLIGDSAHAALQSFAQGGGMAFEDVACLAKLVTQNGTDYAKAFKQFEKARFIRTTRLQLESRALWNDYHCAGIDAEIRNVQYLERTPDDFYRCLDWLWLVDQKTTSTAPVTR
jgi:3-hydroxybenzoate 6-monooxygenase